MSYFYKPNGRFMNETREYILKTSLLLFLQKSYKEVTMREIVEKTGLSKGAFYHYFKSKEELYREILTMMFSLGDVNYAQFPQESLEEFYKQYLLFTEESNKQLNQLFSTNENDSLSLNFFLIMFEAMAKYPEFLSMEYEEYRRGIAAWSKVIQTAKDSGEIRSVSSNENIANLFLQTTDGSFIRYLNHPEFKGSYIDFLKNTFETIYMNLKA